jgi:hypothetical protein
MKPLSRFSRLALPGGLSMVVALAACGGGGGGSSAEPAASITGTAAFGAAMVGSAVQVIDRSGATVCANAPVTTDASGVYTCQLSSVSQAPMVVVVSDATGLNSPLVSLLVSKPAPGSSATVHVTPLTTALAAQVDASATGGQPRSALAWIRQPASLGNLNVASLRAATGNLVTQLTAVLASVGVDPTNFDPFSTPISAGSGTGVDAVLEQIRVSYAADGTPQLANLLNPSVAPVPMASPTTTSPLTVTTSAMVTSPGATPAFSISEIDIFATEMRRCFVLPAATRAPNPDTVNRRLNGVDAACQGFVASAGDVPNVDIDFLQNGYAPEAYFYSLFTDPNMDGGRFPRPELMWVRPMEDGRHIALLNIKFADKNGVGGNRILVARKFPGSRPGAQSQWWLVGNQRALDVFIRPAVAQRDQTIPTSVLDASSLFDEAVRSRLEVGLQIFVHRPNNGTTVNNPNNPNNAVRYMRVKGPGLPSAGIVLADVAASDGRTSMSFLNVTGSIPASVSPQLAENSGDIFRLQRTRGIGTSAVERTNPSVDVNAISSLNWAHPLMFGQSPSSTWQADISVVKANTEYTFEAFCASPTVPCHTFTGLLATNLVSAMGAAQLPWVGLTPASRALVSDGAVATSALAIAWTAPSLIERVSSVYVQGYTASVFADGSSGVPLGSTSQTVTANRSGVYPAISHSSNAASRAIRFQYAMLDGSYKEQWFHFN